ncbi:MAG TPA: type II toxin-antitoxin system HicB family antitoxin [Polyangiaceae bacterium]|nr:type II toxin-antitoxin system HicB family antitoxin [Polyangiaceae bacterium]
MQPGHLFVSFWHITLSNLPVGCFVHRRISAEQARALIQTARDAGTLSCVSKADLLAPERKRAAEQQDELLQVLAQHYGIALSFDDFLSSLDAEGEEDVGRQVTRPLDLVAVTGSGRLMVIDCHYEWPEQRKPRELKFEIAPDTVTFHLFETIEVQSTDTAAGDVPSKLSVRFEAQDDGWLVVSVPELPGCHTQARSIEEGHERIREAIALVLDLPGERYEGELVSEPA